jgi:hypothetical protein
VVTASAAVASATERVNGTLAVWEGELESVAFTVTENLPLVVGVPEITPFARLSPDGRLPEVIDQAYGAVPPFACNALE